MKNLINDDAIWQSGDDTNAAALYEEIMSPKKKHENVLKNIKHNINEVEDGVSRHKSHTKRK